jgi:AcrR family transcriptional regulator
VAPAGRERSVGRDGSLGRGARGRILAAAAELFARQGFNATSINELRAAARVSKRTLYQHFASKDELILTYLAEYARRGPIEALLRREDLAPRSRLLELFTALADPQCLLPDPLVAAATEFPQPGHPVHEAAREHAEAFGARLAALAREAGARDPERTARRLAMLYDGACCRLLVEDVATVVADAYRLATAILRDAVD